MPTTTTSAVAPSAVITAEIISKTICGHQIRERIFVNGKDAGIVESDDGYWNCGVQSAKTEIGGLHGEWKFWRNRTFAINYLCRKHAARQEAKRKHAARQEAKQ